MFDQHPSRRVFAPIILAHEPSFDLSGLTVRPATRQIISDGGAQTLEPRVMQVLIVLAQAGGEVVSRNDLVAACWGGRIVGENAINRVISRLRGLGSDLGGAFEIETISRVGYRLLSRSGRPPGAGQAGAASGKRPRSSSRWSRRSLGIAAAAMAASGGAIAVWATRRRSPSPAARELYERALNAQRQGLDDQTSQAISFLEEAVRLEPDYAEAWGALALSYRHRLENGPAADAAVLAGWITAAADRALKLDPGNADAAVAKILVKPHYRNWAVSEANYRQTLTRHPTHWLLNGTLGRLMYEVGRWRDGVPYFQSNVARDPFLPVSHYFLALGLWNSGRWQEAGSEIGRAFARWPAHPSIWFLRFDFLVHTGRPDEARAFAENVGGRPFNDADARFVELAEFASAMAGRDAALVRDVADRIFNETRGHSARTPNSVPKLAALGAVDQAFALLDDYFLLAADAAPIEPLARRTTSFLFNSPAAVLRADDRFAKLTSVIGLEAYWRTAGVRPDYQRRV